MGGACTRAGPQVLPHLWPAALIPFSSRLIIINFLWLCKWFSNFILYPRACQRYGTRKVCGIVRIRGGILECYAPSVSFPNGRPFSILRPVLTPFRLPLTIIFNKSCQNRSHAGVRAHGTAAPRRFHGAFHFHRAPWTRPHVPYPKTILD